jgi:hypothetical protein
MKFCKYCDEPNGDDNPKCFKCGKSFYIKKVCKECGTTYDDGSDYCMECGKYLSDYHEKAYTVPTRDTPSLLKLMLISAGALSAAFVIALFSFDSSGSEKKKLESSSSSKHEYSYSFDESSYFSFDSISPASGRGFQDIKYLSSLSHGEMLDIKDQREYGVLIIKAKISSSYSNSATINQNFMNVEDIVKKYDVSAYDEIQYLAVATMSDGSEEKVISFTIRRNCIGLIMQGDIVGGMIKDYASDLWIHNCLK